MSHDGKRFWDRHARNYDRSMVLLGRPMARAGDLVASSVAGLGRVLELAAGTGHITLRLARAAEQVVATDYADAMVAALRERTSGLANVRCERADLYDLPYPAGSFEAVVAANVLHLVPDVPKALAAMRRMTRPGGLLVVPTFCHAETVVSRTLSRLLTLTGFPGLQRFTSVSFRAALQSAGLEVTRFEVIPGPIPIAYAEAKSL